jgi:polysaccharide biosynthesis protein PslG
VEPKTCQTSFLDDFHLGSVVLGIERIEFMKSVFAALSGSILVVGSGAELPPTVVPAGVGVNIHFVTGHQQDLDLIAAAGFKFIRMDFGWEATEPKKGEYKWKDYEELLSKLDQRGIRALFILDYSHHLYEPEVSSPHPFNGAPHKTTASPQHPESLAAYANWAAAAATHFKGRHVIWEIWNEPNIQFWNPKPDAHQYTELAVATCKAIREADPAATILAPASSGFPWEFLETLFQSGILRYLDAVSVHPYRDRRKGPETAAADFTRLRQLIGRYKPSDRPDMTIVSGEWGYSSNTKGVTLETQAAFAVRQQLGNLVNGLPLSIWYDWKNDGDDPNENEHNFGTVTPDLKPKPAYTALKVMTRELAGYHAIPGPDTSGTNQDFIRAFANSSGQEKTVVWTAGEAHEITINVPATLPTKMIRGVKGTGEAVSFPVTPTNSIAVRLEPMPQYLDLPTRSSSASEKR